MTSLTPAMENGPTRGERTDVRSSARRVRLVFCIDNMNVGGTELNAVRTAECLDRSRYDLSVISLQSDGPLVARYESAGIPIDRFVLGSFYSTNAVRQGLRLRHFLRQNQVDILHAHDVYSNIFAVPWGRSAGTRTIASRRWWEPPPGGHWSLASRMAHRIAHANLANSPRVAEMLRRQAALAEDRVFVVPNFVEEDAFGPPPPEQAAELRARLGLQAADRAVGIVANLTPIKNHEMLLRAFALVAGAHPDVKLVLIGDGPRRPALERLALELGLAHRILFPGRLANRPNLHALFDVSVLSSSNEGLPNSIIEAQAAGRPVVATAVGAIPDVVIEGENGLLVPPGDAAAFARALATLLENPELAARMGLAGQRRAREQHSVSAALAALERVYAHLLAGRPQAGVPVHAHTPPEA